MKVTDLSAAKTFPCWMALVPASITAYVTSSTIFSSKSYCPVSSRIRAWTSESSSRRLPIVRVMAPFSSAWGVGLPAPMRATVSEPETASSMEGAQTGAVSQHFQGDQGDVVRLLGALREQRNVGRDGLQHLPGREVPGEAARQLEEALLPVILHRAVPGVGDAVRVEDQRVSLRERRARLAVGRLRVDPERDPAEIEEAAAAPRGEQDRIVVARVREREVQAGRGNARQEAGGEPVVGGRVEDEPVQAVHHLPDRLAILRLGTNRRLHHGGEKRRGHALARHIGDGDEVASRAHVHDVVVVAPHLLVGHVHRRDPEPAHLGKAPGQELLLDPARDRELLLEHGFRDVLLVEEGVLQGHARLKNALLYEENLAKSVLEEEL